uniref:PHD-type zinc finger plants domain-containing protein n=1 Tax=Picea sitchensis TaxID=3332 RepID=D5ADD9_PICSI|nr:unknown [Picea sitchensis]
MSLKYNDSITGSSGNKLRKRPSMDHERKKIQYSSRDITRKDKEKDCCMCGDVGFQERLFRCNICHHRFQHIYCSRLYSDQLELDGLNVCDWCLDFEEKEKIQSHKRKNELQEMETRKTKEVAVSETMSKSASTSTMKQPPSSTIENPRKTNGNPRSPKLHPKFGWSKQNQRLSLPEDCKLSTESSANLHGSFTQRNTTKSGLGRRYKLLSDVLCS